MSKKWWNFVACPACLNQSPTGGENIIRNCTYCGGKGFIIYKLGQPYDDDDDDCTQSQGIPPGYHIYPEKSKAKSIFVRLEKFLSTFKNIKLIEKKEEIKKETVDKNLKDFINTKDHIIKTKSGKLSPG